jgi:hypothetical protein
VLKVRLVGDSVTAGVPAWARRLKSKTRLAASHTQVRALGLKRECLGKPDRMWFEVKRTDPYNMLSESYDKGEG